jgi:hypothetical protein
MGKKFGINSKAEEGRAKKAAVADDKKRQAQAKKETEEAKEWEKGAYKNKKKEEEEAKRLEKLAKKKEREELERKEQAELAKYKPTRQADNNNSVKSANIIRNEKSIAAEALRGAAADISGSSASPKYHLSPSSSDTLLETYSASNLDDALSLMESLNVEPSTGTLDRHPERRMKAAYAAFVDRELPILKAENPGLRLSQLKERLFRAWQKSPDNPFNQAHIAHTATREEERRALREQAELDLERFKVTPPP